MIGPKTRKNIYDEHVRKFLTDEVLKNLQQGPQTIKIGDLGTYHTKYSGLEGELEAYDTGESGTHKNSIIKIKFKVTKKGKEQAIYEIYLKYPLTDKAREHTHYNWHYNEEALEDKVSIIPVSGGDGRPKTHAYSEYAGEALLDLKPEENIENAVILSYMLGASVESIKAVCGEKVDAILHKFADPAKPTDCTLMDTLVKFPQGYLTQAEEGALVDKLFDLLIKRPEEINSADLIKEAKKYDGPYKNDVKALVDLLKTSNDCRNAIPAEHKGKELTHTYKEYEGCFQKGIERIFQETGKRIESVRNTYTKMEEALLQELGKLSQIPKKDSDNTKGIKDELDGVQNAKSVFEKNIIEFEKLRKKYNNFFDEKIPTVSCPVDLIEVSRNLRILRPKEGKPQAYLIDQWLPEGKTFLDLRGSPITVYYMLKCVSETEREVGVKRLLEHVCLALEKEFVNDDAKTNYWINYKKDIEEIVNCWHFWRNMRSIADRQKLVFDPARQSVEDKPADSQNG